MSQALKSSLLELKALNEQAKKLTARIEVERSRLLFQCACCPSKHAIRECVAIQTHWYTPPRGCTEGDYWNPGEIHILCPVTGHANRVLFHSHYKVDWSVRDRYEYSAEKQFNSMYLSLFKEVKDTFQDENKVPWVNNYTFDDNRAKYGLHVKGLDKEQ